MRKKESKITFAIYFAMIMMVLFTVFFILFFLFGSFMNNTELTSTYGMIKNGNENMEFAWFHLLPHNFSMEQYKNVLWQTSGFWFYFWNSIFYTIPILIGTIIVSVLGGYAFAKFQFPLRKFWLAVYILAMMIPYQVMISPTLIVLNNIGLVNSRLSIILPNVFTPFGTYLIYQFICAVPDETLEAARVDGAGNIKILLRIVLPQIKNAIAALAVLNIIDTWNLVEQPIMFLKNTFKHPLSVALYYSQTSDIGTAFVCGVVFVIPVVLVFLIGKDHMIQGIKNSVVGK